MGYKIIILTVDLNFRTKHKNDTLRTQIITIIILKITHLLTYQDWHLII